MFSGARKNRGNSMKSELSCSIGIDRFSSVHDIYEIGLQKYKNIYNYVGFSHGFLEKWKMGSSECFVLLSFSWYSGAPCRYFGPKWGPCPKTFHFVHFFIGVWEGKSRGIVCENHQYALGFNWYFACGDDGKLDSKSTKILLDLCRVSATFPPNSGKVVAEVSIHH